MTDATHRNTADDTVGESSKHRVLSLRITDEIHDTLTDTSERVGLSKSDVARLAIMRGASVLTEQLKTES